MAANKLPGAAVVGDSMGGLVGLMLAKAHPGDVGKLMVVDALPYVGDIFVPGATVAQIEPQAQAIRDRKVASYPQPDAAQAQATAAGKDMTPAAQRAEGRSVGKECVSQGRYRWQGDHEKTKKKK